MNVSNTQIQELFRAIPDPKLREQLSGIVNSTAVKAVYCTSEDLLGTITEPVLDKKGKPVVKDGVAKTKEVEGVIKEGCKGRLIAYIMNTGKVQAVSEGDKTYLRSSRHRFDGFMGFECWCGNDSRLAPQEKGYIGANAPDKTALQKVWEKVNNKPSQYPVIKGSQKIDGFEIREIK